MVSWEAKNKGIYAQRFSDDGEIVDDALLLNEEGRNSQVVSFSEGGYAVVWEAGTNIEMTVALPCGVANCMVCSNSECDACFDGYFMQSG